MVATILELDMHLRDERLLAWLQARNKQRIPAHIIATAFKCNRKTVYAMTRRLELAERIKITRSRRGGHTYEVIECQTS